MLVIKNARLLTMTENGSFVGDIRIDGGKIAEIAQNVDTTGCDVFDAEGMYAMPGIIDAHSHIGMWEDGMGREGSDGNEATNPVTPEMRSIDGINPFDNCFTEARAGGVTSVVTGPGSANVIGGQFVAMKTFGRSIEDMTIKFPAAMKAAFGENPKRVFSAQKTFYTRMSIASQLRGTLLDTLEYDRSIKDAKQKGEKPPKIDHSLEAMLPVVRGELPLKIHAHRADDIMTALRIAKEFNLKITLDHFTEGYMIIDRIKPCIDELNAGIIIGPLLHERSKPEVRNRSLTSARTLFDNGVKFAIMTDHPVVPVQYLPVCAALAVREGLPEDVALEAITINAARIAGIDSRVGSLEVGKDADIAVFYGHPFDFRSRCAMTLINGRIVHDEL